MVFLNTQSVIAFSARSRESIFTSSACTARGRLNSIWRLLLSRWGNCCPMLTLTWFVIAKANNACCGFTIVRRLTGDAGAARRPAATGQRWRHFERAHGHHDACVLLKAAVAGGDRRNSSPESTESACSPCLPAEMAGPENFLGFNETLALSENST